MNTMGFINTYRFNQFFILNPKINLKFENLSQSKYICDDGITGSKRSIIFVYYINNIKIY